MPWARWHAQLEPERLLVAEVPAARATAAAPAEKVNSWATAEELPRELAELVWHQVQAARVVALLAAVAARASLCPVRLASRAWVDARMPDPDAHPTHALSYGHPSHPARGVHPSHAWARRVQQQECALTLHPPNSLVGLRQTAVRCQCTRVDARTASWRR